jgi:hypothetical protein
MNPDPLRPSGTDRDYFAGGHPADTMGCRIGCIVAILSALAMAGAVGLIARAIGRLV